MNLVLKHWRTALLVVCLAVVAWSWRQREQALIAVGEARAKAHALDSLLALNGTKIAKTDTVLVDRLRDVKRILTRVDTIREYRTDTLFALEDTSHAVPLLAIPSSIFNFLTDTLAPKCDALEKDCAKFREEAQERFKLYEARLNTKATSVCPSPVKPALVGATAALLLKALVHH